MTLPILRATKRTRVYQTLRHWSWLLRDKEYRSQDRIARDAFDRFCRQEGGLGLSVDLFPRQSSLKTVLVVSQAYPPFAKMEAWVMKAFQMAGFRTVVMRNRRYEFLRYGWLAGNATVYEAEDFDTQGDPDWVDQQVNGLGSLQQWLDLKYREVHVGRFTIASVLRRLKVGQLNFRDPSLQATLKGFLSGSVGMVRGGAQVLERVRPDCVLIMDRGYSGYGEVFDLAINQGMDAVVWQLGYKSNRIVFKRYNGTNERDHILCPSGESWQRLSAMPWSAELGEQVRTELRHCYQSQDWFSMVGTQFDKTIHSQASTRNKLGLPNDRKVAVIFPHILWDGSFFSGNDLFEDYTEWLIETVRAACSNPRLQWVVKLHPAHVVKAKQGNDSGKPSELAVIERSIGALPPHVTLIHPHTDLSTYSLFEIADYVITVRGTVGIEAALFGIPPVTAGTGRYDRRGFSLDSSSREEYLNKLGNLETYPRLSATQVQAAERYAYGVFFARPLALTSVSLEYERDGKATPKFTVRCQSREEWMDAPDLRALSGWIAEGKTEDLLALPLN